MSHQNPNLSPKEIVDVNGHRKRVWVNGNKNASGSGDAVVSRQRRMTMRSSLEQNMVESGDALSELTSGKTPDAQQSKQSVTVNNITRSMFGDSAESLANRPVPSVKTGPQKWDIVSVAPSTQKAMGALEDFRYVGTPFEKGALTQAFAGVR